VSHPDELRKRLNLEQKNSAIREQIATLRTNQIGRITGDFKMDLIKQ